MAGKVEIIVGLVEKADKHVGYASAGTSLIDQYNTDKKGFELVNQSTQSGAAAVATVTSIVQLTKGFVPFLNVQTNAVAGTVVFLKITADYKRGQFNAGDVVSLVGNVAGVAAGFTFLVAGATAASGFVAVAVVASLAGIVTSEAMKNLLNSTVLPVWNNYFKDKPSATYPDYWVAPDLKLVPLSEIIARYGKKIAVNHWDPRTQTVKLSSAVGVSTVPSGAGQGGGGRFGGGVVFPPSTNPTPRPLDEIEIFIESINGKPVQDSYGCVSGSQDGYH